MIRGISERAKRNRLRRRELGIKGQCVDEYTERLIDSNPRYSSIAFFISSVRSAQKKEHREGIDCSSTCPCT